MSELMIEKSSSLPNIWIKTTIGDIVEPSKEKVDPTKSKEKIFIGLEHIKSGTGKIIEKGNSKDVKSTKSLFHKNDILYGKLRPYLNKVAVPNFDGICSTDILVFPQNNHLESKYVAWFLSTNDFVKYANNTASGVQHPRTSFEKISDYDFPLAPLNEQKRIVAKIEELFSKIESTKHALEEAKIKLKQYRHSLLKSAFVGKLVPHDPNDEPASTLLQKIGLKKQGSDFHMSELVLENDRELPTWWEITTLGNVCDINSGIGFPLMYQGEKGGEYPFYKVGDISKTVQSGQSVLTDADNYVSKEICNVLHGKPFSKNTIVFAKIGEALKLNRRALVTKECLVDNNVMGLTPSEFIDTLYLFYYTNTIKLENYSRATTTPSIRKTDVESLIIPLPSLNEQKRIVAKIEECFSLIQNSEKLVESLLLQNNSIKNSILKQAFEGKLIPQDPNDEPAEVLLEKIKQEKQKTISQTKSRKKNGK